jgi:predicted nucleic-acid-binding protein
LISVDTNILARYYLNDDPDQAQLAQSLIEHYAIHVTKTVVLELEWVLRGVAKIDRASISRCFSHLLSLPDADMEQRNQIEQAFVHYQAGLDFADALHLAAS